MFSGDIGTATYIKPGHFIPNPRAGLCIVLSVIYSVFGIVSDMSIYYKTTDRVLSSSLVQSSFLLPTHFYVRGSKVFNSIQDELLLQVYVQSSTVLRFPFVTRVLENP